MLWVSTKLIIIYLIIRHSKVVKTNLIKLRFMNHTDEKRHITQGSPKDGGSSPRNLREKGSLSDRKKEY